MSFECAVKPPVVPSLVQEEMVALGTVLIGAITVIFALVLQSFLDTSGDEVLRQSINVIKEDPAIEVYLKKFRKPSLKKDYKGYKGHCYRVFTYAMHILNAEFADDEGSKNKLKENYPAIAAAIAFHDIGLWTDNTLQYIEPSTKRARMDLKSDFSYSELELIHNIIYWHHKITEYTEEKEGFNQKVIEAVRKADWIDATKGIITKGMPRQHIQTVESMIPEEGFHMCLINFGPKLYGYNIYRIVKELSSILRI